MTAMLLLGLVAAFYVDRIIRTVDGHDPFSQRKQALGHIGLSIAMQPGSRRAEGSWSPCITRALALRPREMPLPQPGPRSLRRVGRLSHLGSVSRDGRQGQ